MRRVLNRLRRKFDVGRKFHVREEPATESSPETTQSGAATPRFVDWFPSPQNAARAFAGEWSSAVPGLPTGQATLFDDERIRWFDARLGGFAGLRVLELGPLEAGHTFMMSQRGATILAIESNLRAWLRCLAVKETLGIPNSTFLLGDFTQYVRDTGERYDFILASGVLYHMTDPVGLLCDLARLGDRIGMWTHYFDPEILAADPRAKERFEFAPKLVRTPSGREVAVHNQRYLQSLEWGGFCGGAARDSEWMTRDGILDVLADFGFACDVGFDHSDHPNGPAFCVFASRDPEAGPRSLIGAAGPES